ncbi:MAG: hypothetical protein AB7P76_01240 [Candidatus Melainabacteria bacterium]
MKVTLMCAAQNRLGALDRILGILTHQGFLPEHFEARMDEDRAEIRVAVTFETDADAAAIGRLVKLLKRQVYVMEAFRMDDPSANAPDQTHSEKSTVFVSLFKKDQAAVDVMERKETYANHS